MPRADRTFKGPHTLELVQDLIATRPTASARVHSGASPVAWVVQTADGSMGMGHTLEAYRQQG